MTNGLTDKQRVFIEHYLTCWNATEAARQAGYKQPHVQGAQNLAKLSIQEAVKTRIAEKAMTADEVLLRLADQARGTMADFLTDMGSRVQLDLRKAEKLDRLHLVKKYSVTRQGVSVELYDAQAALVHIGKHHGLFVERHEHSGTFNIHQAREQLAGKLDSIAANAAAASVPSESE